MAKQKATLVQGLLGGLVGGLVATFAMSQFRTATRKVGGAQEGGFAEREQRGQASPHSATAEAADQASTALTGQRLDTEEKATAGLLTHYATGAGAGLVYGLLADNLPVSSYAGGLLLGGAMFAADELVVPRLGLTKPASQTPLSTHLNNLLAHSIFGLTAEAVRQLVVRLLQR